jgi:hypothetical protein
MRVVVSIGAGYPELLTDLEKLSGRERAERLRVLATAGLAALRGGAVAVAPIAPVATGEMTAARRALFRKLGGSLPE